jgi:hypothetical protein
MRPSSFKTEWSISEEKARQEDLEILSITLLATGLSCLLSLFWLI